MIDPAVPLSRARSAAQSRLDALRSDVTEIMRSASSTTADDEHDPEGATIGFERAQASALLEQEQQHLALIDAALARVADGSYGRCVDCGTEIGPARLEARPEAERCITCASRRS